MRKTVPKTLALSTLITVTVIGVPTLVTLVNFDVNLVNIESDNGGLADDPEIVRRLQDNLSETRTINGQLAQ
jgi:hypothetical protein